jgi:hypothetical protein
MRFSTFIFLFLMHASNGQTLDWVKPSADSMQKIIRSMQRGETDAQRYDAGVIFDSVILGYLSTDSNVTHLPDFAPNIACVKPSDDTWRMLTWTVPSYDGDAYVYHGYLQWYCSSQNRFLLFRLTDSSAVVKKPESEKLLPERWFGTTYYEVVHRKRKGVTYYTLLGWKGKNRSITQKVLEVFYFEKDQPKFGYPLFKKEGVIKSRIVFSFTAQATMSLRYEPSRKMIIYDHLYVPKTSGPNDPSQAGPDGSYDGYRFKGGRWQWVGDLKLKLKTKPTPSH